MLNHKDLFFFLSSCLSAVTRFLIFTETIFEFLVAVTPAIYKIRTKICSKISE